MIDIALYRHLEAQARSSNEHFLASRIHFVDYQELTYLSELRRFVNAMQESRFSDYCQELGGTSERERWLYSEVLKWSLDFQRRHFGPAPIIPKDCAIAAVRIVSILQHLCPNAYSILEIGPGSGLVGIALGIAGHYQYTVVEAYEPFFLLQHLMYRDFFGEKLSSPLDESAFLSLYVKAVHLPYWHIDKVVGSYDIITSNANLMEFSPEAARIYLRLWKDHLHSNGILLIRCFGGGPRGGVEGIRNSFQLLEEFGFRSIFFNSQLVVPTGIFVHKENPREEITEIVDMSVPRSNKIKL